MKVRPTTVHVDDDHIWHVLIGSSSVFFLPPTETPWNLPTSMSNSWSARILDESPRGWPQQFRKKPILQIKSFTELADDQNARGFAPVFVT
jgi:hypothetical protein